jgi:hypothetical protein
MKRCEPDAASGELAVAASIQGSASGCCRSQYRGHAERKHRPTFCTFRPRRARHSRFGVGPLARPKRTHPPDLPIPGSRFCSLWIAQASMFLRYRAYAPSNGSCRPQQRRWLAATASGGRRRPEPVSQRDCAIGGMSAHWAARRTTLRHRRNGEYGHYWPAYRWQSDHVERSRPPDKPPADMLVVVEADRIVYTEHWLRRDGYAPRQFWRAQDHARGNTPADSIRSADDASPSAPS